MIFGGLMIASMISDCVVCISIERLRRVGEYDADLWFSSQVVFKNSCWSYKSTSCWGLWYFCRFWLCVCVLFKPNWIVRSKGGRWEEIDGNWSIPNQDQARQASPCFGSKIKPHEFHRCWIKRPQQETKEHVILLRVGDKNKSETKIITAGPRWINWKISGPTHLGPDKSMHHHPRCSFFSWFLPLLRCGGASNARIILIMMVLTKTLLPKKFKPPIIP